MPDEGMRQTSISKITEADLPPAGAGWFAICEFALTFDGYCFWGEFGQCADIANQAIKNWQEHGTLPASLLELRTCLFFEQRRWHHFGETPDKDNLVYIHAIVEAIRTNVLKKDA